jgi:hypothetical protein
MLIDWPSPPIKYWLRIGKKNKEKNVRPNLVEAMMQQRVDWLVPFKYLSRSLRVRLSLPLQFYRTVLLPT